MTLGSNEYVRDVEDFEPVSVQISVNRGPISGIAASPDGGRLMVTNYGAGSVSIIDTDYYRVVETIPGVDEPFALAMGPSGQAYVSTVSSAYDAIQVIDLGTGAVTATHPVALSVSDLAAGADGKHLFISRNGTRNADVAVMDLGTGALQVVDVSTSAGTTTECVRVSPDGSRVYVGVNGPSGGQVVVLDTGAAPEETGGRSRWRRKSRPKAGTAPAVLETIEIGLPVRDVAVSPNGALVYVASTGPEFAVLDVVDTRTNKITATRKITELSGFLTRLTLSADGERAYLVSDDTVTVLCTLTQDVVESLNVASQPSCVAESRDGRYLYIADYSGAVIVAPIEQSGAEQPALEGKLFVPELPQYDAALV